MVESIRRRWVPLGVSHVPHPVEVRPAGLHHVTQPEKMHIAEVYENELNRVQMS